MHVCMWNGCVVLIEHNSRMLIWRQLALLKSKRDTSRVDKIRRDWTDGEDGFTTRAAPAK